MAAIDITGGMNGGTYNVDTGRLRVASPMDQMNGGPGGNMGTTYGQTNQAGSQQDPFGYTLGSLLTPWTKQFAPPTTTGEQPESGDSGGAPGAPPPSFNYPSFNYSFDNPGRYQSPDIFKAPSDPFQYGAFDPKAGGSFQGDRVSAPGQFQAPVSPYQQAAYQQPGAFQSGVGAFQGQQFTGPAQYQAPDKFVMGDITQDPSYQFRLQQGQQALENSASAKGVLRTGGTMKDLINYGQGAASQEYQNAYARQYGQHQDEAQLGLAAYDRQLQGATAAYDRNYQSALDTNQIAYGRASSEYDRNAAMGADTWDRNFNAGMAQNEQAYGRASSEYDRNIQNQLAANNTNYARASSEYDRNYGNEMARYQMGYQNAAGEYDRNFQNAAAVHQMNTGNALDAYNANVNSASTMGRLGYDVAAGGYDRNFNAYQTAFGIDEARRQQAAAMAAGGGGGGGSSATQDYNRALQQYQMEYDIYNNNQSNQFNRLVTLAQLGQGGASQVGAYGNNYAANGGNTMMGAGNAGAAGVIGAANANQNAYSSIGNAAMQGLGAYLTMQQPTGPSMQQYQ